MRDLFFFALILISAANQAGADTTASVVDSGQQQQQPLPSENALTKGGEAFLENMVGRALSLAGLRRDPSPDRKRVERIVIVTNDVIGPEDPYPKFGNMFHATTVSDVVARELLFQQGEPWNPDLVAESARNLRNNLYVATATIVAAQGSRPDTVVALVVTKDEWSLRPEMSFSIVGTQLQVLQAHPAEYNLAGRNKTLGGDFDLDLATYQIGAHYIDPRVFGSRVATSESGTVIWNRDTSVQEGGTANLSLGQPLYSLSTEWAWNISVNYLKDIYRLFEDGQLEYVAVPGGILPYEYTQHTLQTQASVTRSFGYAVKQNVTFGWRGDVLDFGLPPIATSVPQSSLNLFQQDIMPYTESYGELFIDYAMYTPDFRIFTDVDTFGLPEDYQLGPNFTLEAALANPAFGYGSSFFAPSATLGYLWLLGTDDLLQTTLSGAARRETGVWIGSDWVDQVATASVKNVSKRFGIFRLVSAAFIQRRVHDLDHTVTDLGSDDSLRGFPSAYLIGPNVWGANFELRSEPWAIRTVHIGGVAFVDMGDTFYSPSQLTYYSSVGAGLRVGMPQINRPVFRLDFGIPLQQLTQTPAYVVATFGQAF